MGVARIFFVLACFATVLLISNFGVGLWVGDLNGKATAVKEASNAYAPASAAPGGPQPCSQLLINQ